jgi:hypothetical protein
MVIVYSVVLISPEMAYGNAVPLFTVISDGPVPCILIPVYVGTAGSTQLRVILLEVIDPPVIFISGIVASEFRSPLPIPSQHDEKIMEQSIDSANPDKIFRVKMVRFIFPSLSAIF